MNKHRHEFSAGLLHRVRYADKLTLDVADLKLLGERQYGDIDLCSRALLQKVHELPLLPDQSTNQMLQRQVLI